LNADVTAAGGEIGKVRAMGDINGSIESTASINKVISKTGGLTDGSAVVANQGSISKAKFAADVSGMVLASDEIGNLSSASGTLSGTVRAGSAIGKIKFAEINSATVSSWGDIKSVESKGSIIDTLLLAGTDIGMDGLPGTNDLGEGFNLDGASIGSIKANLVEGNFDGSYALAGVKPFEYDVNNQIMLAPEGSQQVLAAFGGIGKATVGQVFFTGDPNAGIYGLFAATEIGNVKYTEIAGAGAPDFEIQQTW
jgi:hypothetical protein